MQSPAPSQACGPLHTGLVSGMPGGIGAQIPKETVNPAEKQSAALLYLNTSTNGANWTNSTRGNGLDASSHSVLFGRVCWSN